MHRFGLVLFALAIAGAAMARGVQDFVPGEILVGHQSGRNFAAHAVIAAAGASSVERIGSLDILRVKMRSDASVSRLMNALGRTPGVTFVERNGIWRTAFTPNDTSFSRQWGMTNIRAPLGWDLERGSASVRVAILDTGIDRDHPDIGAKVVAQYNALNNSNNADDFNGHGTHCAGIAAAMTHNARGVAGVGFNVSLVAVKVLSDGGSGSWGDIAEGIDWASTTGQSRVLSLSLGGSGGSSAVETAVNNAWNRGAVIMAAAGNNGSTSRFFPAAYANVIAVASNDSNDRRSSFSNWGSSWVDVTAPGQGIFSTLPNNSYGSLDGTSMSCPHVAGLAGLVFSRGGNITAAQARAFIENNCDPEQGGDYVAFGRINVFRTMQAINADRAFSPWFVQTLRGNFVSGDVNSLVNADDSRYNVGQVASPSLATPNAQVLVAGGVDVRSYSAMTVRIEAQCSAAPSSSIAYRIDAFNWQSNSWETVFTGNPTISDTVVNIALTGDVNRFVDQGGGDVQIRVSWFDRGAAGLNWQGRIDQVSWIVR